VGGFVSTALDSDPIHRFLLSIVGISPHLVRSRTYSRLKASVHIVASLPPVSPPLPSPLPRPPPCITRRRRRTLAGNRCSTPENPEAGWGWRGSSLSTRYRSNTRTSSGPGSVGTSRTAESQSTIPAQFVLRPGAVPGVGTQATSRRHVVASGVGFRV
jgi:hypothetical protein